MALLLQKFMSFARPQAPAQDHEHQERQAKVSKVNTRKRSSCLKVGHDKRNCPKIDHAGSEPYANVNDAVGERESYLCTFNINFDYKRYFIIIFTWMLYFDYSYNDLLGGTFVSSRLNSTAL